MLSLRFPDVGKSLLLVCLHLLNLDAETLCIKWTSWEEILYESIIIEKNSESKYEEQRMLLAKES